MVSNQTHSKCIVAYGGYCEEEQELYPFYVCICLVSLTLAFYAIIVFVYIRYYKTMGARRGDSALVLSLVMAHLLNNVGILALNTTRIVRGTAPELSLIHI